MGIQINGTTDTISAVDGSLDINQNATFGNNVTIGGTLTYSDVTNIDSVGLVTAKNGLRIHAGGIDLTSGISTFSDNIQIADKIIHKDDTDTAIRFPSVNTFSVETANDERLRITSAGKVGINTTNPGAKLSIWADDSDTDTDVFQIRGKTGAFNIRVNDADASNPEWAIRTYSQEPIVFMQGTVEKARLHSDGRVGIGSAIPAARLDVVDSSALGIISRSATTQSTNTNKALKVRNNSTDNTFSVSYRGRGYFADRLGIGTESPQSALHFFSDAPIIKVEPTNWQSGLRVDVMGMGNNAGNGQLFRIQKDAATKFQINEDGDAIVYGDDNA